MKKYNVVRMIVMGIFGLCVTFLLMLGKCCGLNYKQISVAFNLWLARRSIGFVCNMPKCLLDYVWSLLRFHVFLRIVDIDIVCSIECLFIH